MNSNYQNNVPFSVNELQELNSFKRSLQDILVNRKLKTESKHFQNVMSHCKNDPRYISVAFEILLKSTETTRNQTPFELLILLFKKSKEMKSLMTSKLHKIFMSAFALSDVKEYAYNELCILDEKYGKDIPSIHALLMNPRVGEIKDEIDNQRGRLEALQLETYNKTLNRVDEWEQTINNYEHDWYKLMDEVIIKYCDQISDTEEPIQLKDTDVEVKICGSAAEVLNKYASDITRTKMLFVDICKPIEDLRNVVWNGYSSFVGVQQLLDEWNEQAKETYHLMYKRITTCLDRCDGLLEKAKDMGILSI
ncbi:Uncharacterized protein QTN25_001897 [Entamoeba marina]